jgi:2-keto-4-pentenoate hydratase
MMNGADIVKAADLLTVEHASDAPFRPFAKSRGIFNLADAYEVQRAYVHMMQTQTGSTAPAGYKIGLTSKRMQDMCGIDSPIAGVVLSHRVHRSGASISASAYGRLGLEFEIAVRVRRDFRVDAVPSFADVADVVDAVAPAIELIDDRRADYRALDVLSLIADNSWNAGIVVGEFVPVWPELATIEGRAFVDGQALDRGTGGEVLGHPFHPVAWLAGHLAAQGGGLRAGDIVMTGSIVTTKFPERAASYRFDVNGLGAVDLTVVP